MRYKIIYLLLFICFYKTAAAQNEILSQRLRGKTVFKEIMKEVDDYFQSVIGNPLAAPESSEQLKRRKEYKRWKRWEWYHSARLGPDGAITDASKNILELLNQDANNALARDSSITPATPLSTNSGLWTSIGPSGTTPGPNSYGQGIGRCDRISFDPSNAQTYYICTPAGGLWRTTNDGASWTNLTDELPCMGIAGMVVSYNNPAVLYILTGDGDSNTGGFVEGFGYIRWSQGVFKSTDGGSTWQRTGGFPGTPSFYTGFKLVQCPVDPLFLYAATSVGIFKTLDGGDTWTNANATQPAAIYHDVEFKPGTADAYTVAKFGNGSFFFQTTASHNFSISNKPGLPGNNSSANSVIRYAIAVTNANPEHVVLLAGPSVDSTGFQGIYRSVNSGVSFAMRAVTPNILGGAVNGDAAGDQSNYDHCVAIAHNNFQKIISGGLCVWRSDDGGVTNTAITKYFETTVGTQPYIHPDVHDVAYNPLNNYLYACTDGGVYKSTNNGDTWTNISTGLVISQYYHLAGMGTDVNKLLGGLQDNGTLYKNTAGIPFTHIRGADGHRTAINSGNANLIYWTENTNILRSNDAAVTSVNGILPVPANVFYPAFRLNPSNQSKVYIGTGYKLGNNQKNVFYHSDDGGFTYVDSTTVNITKDIACAPSDINVFYGTDGFLLYRTQNEGFSFQLRVGNLPAARVITSLAVNPNNANIVVATLGGFTAGQKVYFTSDGGLNWQNLSGTLPNVPVTSAAINTNGDIYIGTDIGVFYQADAELDWRPFYNGLPRVPVTELIIYPDRDLIRAATFGRGIWETSLYTDCPANSNFSSSVNTPRVYNAATSLTTSQVIIGSTGVNVLYKSGDRITMNPGFRATAGSVMNAIIGPCLPGIDPVTQLRFDKPSGAVKVAPLPPDQTQRTGPKQEYKQ